MWTPSAWLLTGQSTVQLRVPGGARQQQAAGGVPDARAGGLGGVRLRQLQRHPHKGKQFSNRLSSREFPGMSIRKEGSVAVGSGSSSVMLTEQCSN